MHLPGLPTTIASIHARAKNEDWHFETKVGLGGVRKMYEIPAYYLPGYVMPNLDTDAPTLREAQKEDIIEHANKVAQVARETVSADLVNHKLLAKAIVTVDTYLLGHKVHLTPQRRAEIVSIVYSFMQGNENKEAVENLIKLVA